MNVSETELGVNTVDGHVVDVQMAGAEKPKPGMLSSGWNIWLRG